MKETEIIAIKEQSERGIQHQNPSGLGPLCTGAATHWQGCEGIFNQIAQSAHLGANKHLNALAPLMAQTFMRKKRPPPI